MTLHARLEVSPSVESRRGLRRELRLNAESSLLGSDVVVRNLSETGLLIQTASPLQCGDLIDVTLPDLDSTQATVVWGRDQLYGCEFLTPISLSSVSAFALRSPPLSGFRDDAGKGDRTPGRSFAPGALALLAAVLGLAAILVTLLAWATA